MTWWKMLLGGSKDKKPQSENSPEISFGKDAAFQLKLAQAQPLHQHVVNNTKSQGLPLVDAMLKTLGARAWLASQSRNLGASGFLFTPSILLPRDGESIAASVKSLYEHARRWAPGFEIPYRTPPIRIQSNLRAAGEFKVDEEGWVTIHVSSRYLDHPDAVWLILAHEVCHHILNQSSLDVKIDTTQNERMTDVAMFICGFGNLVKSGFKVVSRSGDAYTKTHLGYLQSAEYAHAYRWVLVARQRNELSGVKGIKVSDATLASDFVVKSTSASLESDFKQMVPDVTVRKRLIELQQQRYPQLTMEDWMNRAIDEYMHDKR